MASYGNPSDREAAKGNGRAKLETFHLIVKCFK